MRADIFRVFGSKSGWRVVLRVLDTPGLRHVLLFRLAQSYGRRHLLGFFAHVFLRWSGRRFGFQIPVSTVIGRGFYLGHFGTVVINGEASIGSNCNIAHGVTIGQTNRGKLRGVPTLGDNVWVGAGAVIVGKVVVGDNVLIAPNSYVNTDVPSGSLVMGNPARFHSKGPSVIDGYIDRRV